MRRTGRTTRMLVDAMKTALATREPVVIVFSSHTEIPHALMLLRDTYPYGTYNHPTKMFEFNGGRMYLTSMGNDIFVREQFRVRGTPKERTFVDHHVYEYLLHNWLEEMHKYDE